MKRLRSTSLVTAIIMLVLNLCSAGIYAQAVWKTNGNNVSEGNYIGTNNNEPMIFKTNGQTRMTLKENGGLDIDGELVADSAEFNGIVKIGNQAGDAFYFLGGVSVPLPPHDLMRVTTSIFTVMGGTKFTTLPLSFMGVNTETPTHMLDVNDGDINVITANRGYMIGGNYVLWHKGNISNIFVGVGAGFLSSGSNNTFMGKDAGRNSTGSNNTFLGYNAGLVNTTAKENVFIGSNAGASNTTADFSVFIGHDAGRNNTTETDNVFIGWKTGVANTGGRAGTFVGTNAGMNNTTGRFNSFYGDEAGLFNQTGENNVFMGFQTGFVITSGSRNTYIGQAANAGGGLPGLNNSAAFGWNAIVRADDKMILGDNSVNVGIGLSNDLVSNGPQNKLEINFSVAGTNTTPNPGLGTGFSGLRFRDLTSTSVPYTVNPGTGVLSVDAFGDVILVPGNIGGGTTLGNPCPSGVQNLLPSDWEIPLNNNNFVFSGQGGIADNNVGIGTSCSPAAKLEVLQASTITGSIAVLVTNNDNVSIGGDFTANGPYAIKGLALQQDPSTLTTTGIYGEAIFNSGRANYGVEGHSSQSSNSNYGGRFQAISGINSPIINYGVKADGMGAVQQNYGVNGTAMGGMVAYGVAGQASAGVTASYGVFGDAAMSSGGGTINDSYAGFFNGDVFFNGATYPSDITIKQNIDSLSNAIAVLKQLKPKTFEYNHAVHPQMNLRNGMQYGLIAQDVETVLPILVTQNTFPPTYDSVGAVLSPSFLIKGVDYQQLIPILIKGIQEQQSIIDSLSQTLSEVITTVNSCCNSNHSMQQNGNNNSIASQDVELKDEQSVILESNVPNPFAEQTTISYFLPDNVKKAQMLFYNVQGKLIQSVDLNERGKGNLNVFAQDLSSGIYTYTLVVDGKVFETKKMIKQQ